MSTRPFKVIIDEHGERVRIDLTDEEIADAQRRTAEEQAVRAVKEQERQTAREIQDFLILVASEHPQAPDSVLKKAAEIRSTKKNGR